MIAENTQQIPARWRQLNLAQKKTFGNGCGPKWFPRWLTRLCFGWLFKASCRRHDFAYARGGNRADRKAADIGFKNGMAQDVEKYRGLKKILANIVAAVFYRLVRLLGLFVFTYGPYQSLAAILNNDALNKRR